jgi:hypothetical protein
LKRREEREENNKIKRSKNYRKGVAMGGAGGRWTSYFIASAVLWKGKSP